MKPRPGPEIAVTSNFDHSASSMDLPRVVLLPRRARPFYGHHPWVYAGAIASIQGEPADGAEVGVVSHGGNFVARGLFNSQSKIRVRLYSWSPDIPLDHAFFRERLAAAVRLRREILQLDTPGRACRLVFSESDGLSGLTIDRYDRWLVVQFTSLALAQRRDMFVELLRELVAPEGILLRTERGIGQLEGVDLQDGPLWGQLPTEPITIDDDGLKFLVNLAEGQKTGFYLDQRDNRQAVAALAKGRRFLDVFSYTGGFGLHAARAGATEVICVDSSKTAVALGIENAKQNSLANVSFVTQDVFSYLDAQAAAGSRYGVIVLDPPKFARHRNAVEDAMRGYRRLHALALQMLEPNGILVTCCCSGLIEMAMLDDLLAQLAVAHNRTIQILERRGQAPDHPVSVACLETNYLKCLISRVC